MSRTGIDLSFEEVFRRVSELTQIKTSTNLAEFLGITSGSVSKHKGSDTFPASWAVLIAEQHGLDLNYLIFGRRYAEKQSGEAVDVFLKEFLEDKGLELDHADSGYKVIRGEVMSLLNRAVGHLRG